MSTLLDKLTDPDVLDAEASLAAVAPPPGPVIAIGLHLIAAWIRAGKTADEVAAIVATYSAEAQELANSWPTAGG